MITSTAGRFSISTPLKRWPTSASWSGNSAHKLLQAEWKNVDLNQQTWFLPSENVKGTRGKKQDHHIFLSPFALHFFQELKTLTGDSQWCFPNKQNDGHVDVKVASKQVGDRQARFKNSKVLSRRRHDDTLVLADGQNGDWTPHDLRRTGATMMQALGVSLDVIDRCQNHVLAGSRVRRHYLHHDYAEEKKCAWKLLAIDLALCCPPHMNINRPSRCCHFERTRQREQYCLHRSESALLPRNLITS
ncbi:site-specific integrase [Xanthomonas sp. WHRI 1810A]|uniref:site-specific integrase n=1 Tax=Xanthomonas sp. WHRI 1810A TaxID=3161565 RepID=UPI0032E88C73